MHTLIISEEKRTGQFVVNTGMHGRLNIVSADRYVLGLIESSDPMNDFNFELDCMKDGKSIGKCTFMISDLPDSKLAVRTLPIKGSPDGSTITFSICWITPFNGVLDSEASPNFPSVLAIGHRGSGSNRVSQKYLENTMESFSAAQKEGADYIEFDVQMTKEDVPVLYHDLSGIVKNSTIYEVGEPHEMTGDGHCRYVIKQFSEEQFRRTGLLTDFKTERISLKDVLKEMPESLSFDIEIKYPTAAKLNTAIPYDNMNEMIDNILNVMIPLIGNRQVIFSSFDPLVCAMLRFKQRKWGVFQLLCRRKHWEQKEFVDRAYSLAPFHKALGVSGFFFDCCHLLESPEVLRLLLDEGFLIGTYGALNNTREGIERQLELGVRGICTDDMALCRTVLDEHLKSL
jgi:glycerophosphodiester phosphodiesterase